MVSEVFEFHLWNFCLIVSNKLMKHIEQHIGERLNDVDGNLTVSKCLLTY